MRFRVILLLLVVIPVVWIILTTQDDSGVTINNAHRIRSGMTLEEVQRIFMNPGGRANGGGMMVSFVQNWKTTNLTIEVIFSLGINADPKTPGVNVINYCTNEDVGDWEMIEPPESSGVRFHRWIASWQFW